MTTQEAFQDAAYWRAFAMQLKRGIERALKEKTSLDPEQYANRVWSHLHNVVNAPVHYQRTVIIESDLFAPMYSDEHGTPCNYEASAQKKRDDERDWMSRE